jgi:hypothetical protein
MTFHTLTRKLHTAMTATLTPRRSMFAEARAADQVRDQWFFEPRYGTDSPYGWADPILDELADTDMYDIVADVVDLPEPADVYPAGTIDLRDPAPFADREADAWADLQAQRDAALDDLALAVFPERGRFYLHAMDTELAELPDPSDRSPEAADAILAVELPPPPPHPLAPPIAKEDR